MDVKHPLRHVLTTTHLFIRKRNSPFEMNHLIFERSSVIVYVNTAPTTEASKSAFLHSWSFKQVILFTSFWCTKTRGPVLWVGACVALQCRHMEVLMILCICSERESWPCFISLRCSAVHSQLVCLNLCFRRWGRGLSVPQCKHFYRKKRCCIFGRVKVCGCVLPWQSCYLPCWQRQFKIEDLK